MLQINVSNRDTPKGGQRNQGICESIFLKILIVGSNLAEMYEMEGFSNLSFVLFTVIRRSHVPDMMVFVYEIRRFVVYLTLFELGYLRK